MNVNIKVAKALETGDFASTLRLLCADPDPTAMSRLVSLIADTTLEEHEERARILLDLSTLRTHEADCLVFESSPQAVLPYIHIWPDGSSKMSIPSASEPESRTLCAMPVNRENNIKHAPRGSWNKPLSHRCSQCLQHLETLNDYHRNIFPYQYHIPWLEECEETHPYSTFASNDQYFFERKMHDLLLAELSAVKPLIALAPTTVDPFTAVLGHGRGTHRFEDIVRQASISAYYQAFVDSAAELAYKNSTKPLSQLPFDELSAYAEIADTDIKGLTTLLTVEDWKTLLILLLPILSSSTNILLYTDILDTYTEALRELLAQRCVKTS